MADKVPRVRLVDGYMMPLLGFGTSWDDPCSEKQKRLGREAIIHAIKVGYRLFDTAALYETETTLGLAIKDCINQGIVERKDLFICSKVWNTCHSRDAVMRSCRESLDRLGLEYLDLYLVHWPMGYAEDGHPFNPKDPKTGKLRFSDVHYKEAWKGMEMVRDKGLSRSIGLSNFNRKMVEDIMTLIRRPVVNQVECHPYRTLDKFRVFSLSYDIYLQAYCPLGAPGKTPDVPQLLDDPEIIAMAKRYNKTPAQIVLRYQIQRSICAIPRSLNPKRIEENFDIFDFVLSDLDMYALNRLDQDLSFCRDIGGEVYTDHPFYPFYPGAFT